MTDDTAQSAADAARTEAARQFIILIFGIAGAIAFVWVQRHASDPDAARTARMRMSRGGEKFYARLAAWAWKQAETARLAYDKDRQ